MTIVLALKIATALLGTSVFLLECLGPEIWEEDHPKYEGNVARVESPVLTANVFSIWSFSWMSKLMKKGAADFITEDDLPDLVDRDRSTKLGEDLQSAMQKG